MGRSPCCDENGLKKGPWTTEEDEKLMEYIQKNGHGSWRALPRLAGLNRCGKSCRLRWTNYLKPGIKRGKFTPDEENTILQLHSALGNKWSAIAKHLSGRTDNEIKNFWNTHLKKRLIQMGFDPMTHKPRTDFFAALPQLIALANLRQLLVDQQRPWDDHGATAAAAAAGLQQVEAAKVQYLQALLQSAASIATSPRSSSINAMPGDLEQIGLPSPPPMSSLSPLPSPMSSLSPLPSPMSSLSPLPSPMSSSLSPLPSPIFLGAGGINGNGQDSLVYGQLPANQMHSSSLFDQPAIINGHPNHNPDYAANSGEREMMTNNGAPKTLLLSTEDSLPPLTDFPAISNLGDVCSTPSCDGNINELPVFSDALFAQLLRDFGSSSSSF
ncbi:hypothetical protein GUJ93_ZPchr0006g44909 [Zizania palustris]|uniref:Uncharacterized protein n=1 Tax=Zizania palustris TaxID=103762 RepID=A0A8J5SVN5_ZIZPA|nr:hypothetical protein GUJ93_ZPchr0006g44909 [Zizania palustris]